LEHGGRRIRREREVEIGDFAHHARRVIGRIYDEILMICDQYQSGGSPELLKTPKLGANRDIYELSRLSKWLFLGFVFFHGLPW
jgi:hypothetical protein